MVHAESSSSAGQSSVKPFDRRVTARCRLRPLAMTGKLTNMMQRVFLYLSFWALLGASQAVLASASVMTCDGQLVRIGDPVWQVARACPAPFWREDFDEPAAVDRLGYPIRWQRVEAWTLNFGSHRFMRRLTFVDGYLRRIDTLGYGVRWEPGSQRCSWRELEMAGSTAAEVFARCGSPDFQYDLPPLNPYSASPWVGRGQRQRWVYDFGGGRHARELEFLNGRLQFINRP